MALRPIKPILLAPEDLMKTMGAESGKWEPVPTEQLTSFLDLHYDPATRVLAWVRLHTVCFPYRKPYCVDERHNELRQKVSRAGHSRTRWRADLL
jgi:hypothetical protein